jgi:hypothetical protein
MFFNRSNPIFSLPLASLILLLQEDDFYPGSEVVLDRLQPLYDVVELNGELIILGIQLPQLTLALQTSLCSSRRATVADATNSTKNLRLRLSWVQREVSLKARTSE